jgi:putative holliday junction resolvase
LTRLLGIDLGARRIGLAVADTQTGEVRPLATIRRSSAARDAEIIGRLVQEQRVDELVLGLPRNMDGSEGTQAVQTRSWAAAVTPLVGLPLAYRDERLSSEGADSRLGRQRRGRSGGPPSAPARAARRAGIDREAAAIIVQSELDARRGLTADGCA